MADKQTLEMKISGAGIKPGMMRARELGEVIGAFEDMIAAYVTQENPKLNKESIVIALTRIEAGSIGLKFSPNLEELTIPAANAVTDAINRNDYSQLPAGSINALRTIAKFTKRHNCETEFRVHNGAARLLATISPETEIPADSPFRGETTVYGEVTRVGGAAPKVQFRTLEGELLYCETSREIAKEIGSRLYSQVGLRGTAAWNARTLKIESFYIEEIIAYEETAATDAFAKLREAAGEFFDDVDDVEAYARQLRYGYTEPE